MRWLARFALRRPGAVLVAWVALFAVAVAVGSSARDRLNTTDLRIPGTESARASDLTTQQFGGTVAIVLLLKGPPTVLERDGPGIVRELERIPKVDVLSPWASGGQRVLLEPSGQALLTLQVRRPFQQIAHDTTPAVERTLARTVHKPLSVEITGLSPLVREINRASLDSLDKGEMIALPVLFLMLLLIFRSPLAALVPALSGLLVTSIGTAIVATFARNVAVDALALNMVTTIGLALGVDYSLLIVSRFREELANGRDVPAAIEEVTARAGRTVLFAGGALSIGMLCALAIAPGALLISATMGVIVAAVVAVLVALLAMPAGLALLGTRIDAWRFGGQAITNPWVRLAERALRKPGVAAFFTLLPLLVLAAPAIGLKTGPPNVANLPPHDKARTSFEAFQRDRGAGWSAPFEVDFHTTDAITTGARLAALQRFQTRVAAIPGVASVLGPASIGERTDALRRVTRQALGGAAGQLGPFQRGLTRAADGTGALRDGLAAGANGADQLVAGLGQVRQGSSQLSQGVHQAAPATRQLAQGIGQAAQGSRKLTSGLQRVAQGGAKLQKNLNVLQASLHDEDVHAGRRWLDPLDDATTKVQLALTELASASPAAAADPSVQEARENVKNALEGLGTVASNLSASSTTLSANATASKGLFNGSKQLASALGQLTAGSGKLAGGLGKAASGSAQLAGGVSRLDSGASTLASGLGTLLTGPHGNDGAKALASGLQSAAVATTELGRGVQRILGGVVRVRQGADRQAAQLRRSGTNVNDIVDSGYFVLAALDGAPRQARTNISFATNAAAGGTTARVIVVPVKGPFDSSRVALRAALEREADRAGHEMGAQALVGGPAVLLDDFQDATSKRFAPLVAILVLVTFLVLLLVFRSPVLALIAVLLNLVTVGAAVGVLVIFFQGGSSPLLGGPGYLDAISLSGIFAVTFGLSIDYEVFLMSRLLEGRARTGTTDGAIRFGLEKTATIITGAAFIMAAVFLAFAVQPVANIRQLGIGLTVAVLIDATLVRLILLPALVRLFGERTWWVPGWLERRVPDLASR
jgi:RND superfamily putative drug exporter